jgi:hypothetical protein
MVYHMLRGENVSLPGERELYRATYTAQVALIDDRGRKSGAE